MNEDRSLLELLPSCLMLEIFSYLPSCVRMALMILFRQDKSLFKFSIDVDIIRSIATTQLKDSMRPGFHQSVKSRSHEIVWYDSYHVCDPLDTDNRLETCADIKENIKRLSERLRFYVFNRHYENAKCRYCVSMQEWYTPLFCDTWKTMYGAPLNICGECFGTLYPIKYVDSSNVYIDYGLNVGTLRKNLVNTFLWNGHELYLEQDILDLSKKLKHTVKCHRRKPTNVVIVDDDESCNTELRSIDKQWPGMSKRDIVKPIIPFQLI
jgi:hypothetical protein